MGINLAKPAAIGAGKRALVVDDHSTMRMLMSSVCSQLGYRALKASNGMQALDLILKEQEKIDLMILDWNMPVMPGITVVEELAEAKAVDRALELPLIILVTGQNFESEIVRAGENIGLIGGYILKPVKAQTVNQKIMKANDKHQRLAQIEYLRRMGEEQLGLDSVNRYDEAVKECFKQDKSINEQGGRAAELKREASIRQMEKRLDDVKSGLSKFASLDQKNKFLEKLVLLRKGGFAPSPVIWPLLEAVRMMDKVGDHVGALRLLDEMQERKVSAWILAEKGKIHENQGNFLLAIKEYREAVLLNPKFLHARDRLSTLLERKGKHGEALEVIKEAVSISPDTPGRRRSEGTLSMKLESFEAAEEAFKHILEVEKAKNSALNNINVGKALLAQPEKHASAAKYLADAEKILERRIEKTPSTVKRDLHYSYGDLYIKSGDIKKAETHIRYGKDKIVSDGSEKEEDITAGAAEVYLKNDLFEKAQGLLSEILDKDPKDGNRQKRVRETLKNFKKESLADEMIQGALTKANNAILKANDDNLKRRKKASKLVESRSYSEAEALFSEALEVYNQLIKNYRSDDGLLFNKGVLLTQMMEALGKNLSDEKVADLKFERDTLFRAAYKIDPARISEGLQKIGISKAELGL